MEQMTFHPVSVILMANDSTGSAEEGMETRTWGKPQQVDVDFDLLNQ